MNRLVRAAVLLCVAVSSATADDYLDGLKAQVRGYENMTTGRFAPMYEPLARQMVEDYGLETGVALDIGSSCSSFPLHLAKQTKMTVYAVDLDAAAMRLLGALVDEAQLTGRVVPVESDATQLLFRDNFADFIFSRGCIPFVSDQVAMIREAYRVLKPGGVAFIGHGGFGRLLDPKIREELVKWRLGWGDDSPRPGGWNGPKEKLLDLAHEAGVKRARLIREPQVGWWLEIRK